MARPKRIRKINSPPGFKGFTPIGEKENSSPVVMNLEEFEAIRLSDYELLGQVEAAERMGISRPTFTRIYESARRKVALAFNQKLPIIFEGGKIYFDTDWYTCHTCGSWFNHPEKESDVISCALCGSEDVSRFSGDPVSATHTGTCICPECGFEKQQDSKCPCNKVKCPQCGHMMTHKQDTPDPKLIHDNPSTHEDSHNLRRKQSR